VSESRINGNLKAALIYGAVSLFSTLIGVLGGAWTGREVVNLELRGLHEAAISNAETVSRNADQLAILTLQVRELSVISTKNFDDVKALEDRIKAIERWRVEISDLASKRGIEIPDLRRRIEVLERGRR